MIYRFSAICLLTFCAAASRGQARSSFEDSLSPPELATIAHALPSGPIYSMRFLREQGNDRLSAAVLTERKGEGWQVLVVSPHGTSGYHISWKSAWLGNSFAVASASELGTYGLGNEDAITFSGCAPHLCPEIFSTLLYVPSIHHAFVGTCENGKTSYSFALTAADSGYKEALDELLHNRIGSEQACSPQAKRGR